MEPQVQPRIVVGVDGSESSLAALDWAVHQAELTGAMLEAVTTWEWPTSYGWSPPYPSDWDPSADAQEVLADAVKRIRQTHSGVGLKTNVVESHPAPALVELSLRADLLVVGSRGHGEFVGMLLGSVSEHCVTNAHCPVVVMRGGD